MPRNPFANSIAAFFRDRSDAENAIGQLTEAGFGPDQIGCSLDDSDYEATATSGQRSWWDKVGNFFSGKTGYEDRDTGSGEGRMQEGPVIGRTLTIPDDYRERLAQGGVFVSVHDATRASEAEEILTRNRGEIVRDMSRFQPAEESRTMASEREFPEQGHRIQLISEVLRVRKERVQRGEVRVRKEVVTETQNVQVPVTREEVVVERVPAEGQPVTGQIGAEKEIRVPLTEERAKVEKVPVVSEEVRVGKRAVEDTSNVSDETRREELKVEKEGDVRELDESEINKPRRKKAA